MPAKTSEKTTEERDERHGARIAPSTWVLIAVVAGTLLLVHAGYTTGEWRGVIVTEVQIAIVGLVTWLALRWAGD